MDDLDRLRRDLAAPLRHPDAAALRALGAQALDWLVHHFATLPDQALGRTGSRAELEALLREPPPEQGRDFARVLAEFAENVSAYAFRPNHPRFFAFIPSAPNYVSVLGDLL